MLDGCENSMTKTCSARKCFVDSRLARTLLRVRLMPVSQGQTVLLVPFSRPPTAEIDAQVNFLPTPGVDVTCSGAERERIGCNAVLDHSTAGFGRRGKSGFNELAAQ
jgi:hypothetical protein